jgi:hypothetical protein
VFDHFGRDVPGSPASATSKVWTAHKRVEKLKYIHRNPVRRGLVQTPDQWRWSSFRAYACGEAGVVVVNDWSVLKMKVFRLERNI